MTAQRYYVTPRGLALLQRRLAEARAAFKAICDDNPAANEAGDSSVWHDNFAYEQNQRLMDQHARRVRALELELEFAVVVDAPPRDPDRVVLGAVVTYQIEGEATPRTCRIVGHGEGEAARRYVAYNSPLGSALLGSELGDDVEMPHLPDGRCARVLGIAAPSDEVAA